MAFLDGIEEGNDAKTNNREAEDPCRLVKTLLNSCCGHDGSIE